MTLVQLPMLPVSLSMVFISSSYSLQRIVLFSGARDTCHSGSRRGGEGAAEPEQATLMVGRHQVTRQVAYFLR